MSRHLRADIQACIEECHRCATICIADALFHCLAKGGAHIERGHFTLMLDCANMCRTAAEFMARGSERHRDTCRLCAEICRACAESCESLDGMEECAEACRRCAESCERMAA